MKKQNIAMLGHKRIPSREGGVEMVVEALASRMVSRGCRVTCYNRGGRKASEKIDNRLQGEYNGIQIKTVPTLDKKGLAAVTSSFFAALFAAFGPYDVVHFHAEGPCAMLWLPRLLGKRCIATIHGLDWQREKWKGGFGSRYIRFGERMAVKYAQEIIVLSKHMQQYFRDTYGRETVLIPNGVTRPATQEADRITREWGLEKDGYLLFLGRIVPEKGLRYLIEAYKTLKTPKKLVIAGGASDTEGFLEEMKVLAKEDHRILFTGFVSGQILEELYSNAYVYILPSDLEGMPLSLLEAMSYGNCCLVSDIPECAEVVEDRAVTFRKGDVGDLRQKLEQLCEAPALVQHYKEKSAEFVCAKYNWDDVTEKTLRLYGGHYENSAGE